MELEARHIRVLAWNIRGRKLEARHVGVLAWNIRWRKLKARHVRVLQRDVVVVRGGHFCS